MLFSTKRFNFLQNHYHLRYKTKDTVTCIDIFNNLFVILLFSITWLAKFSIDLKMKGLNITKIQIRINASAKGGSVNYGAISSLSNMKCYYFMLIICNSNFRAHLSMFIINSNFHANIYKRRIHQKILKAFWISKYFLS